MRRRDREVTEFEEMIKVVDACDVCRLGLSDEKVLEELTEGKREYHPNFFPSDR